MAKQRVGGDKPTSYRLAISRQEMLDEARESLEKATSIMKNYVDQHRQSLEFQVRDKVLLKFTPQILKKISSKTRQRGLIPKFEGPFKLIRKVGEVAYMLKLPKRLKLHPTYHVNFLKPYFEDAYQGWAQVKHAPP